MDRLKTSPSLDADFILAIRSGGMQADKAIIALYGKYQKNVRGWVAKKMMHYGLDKEEADDLVHDSFLTLLQKIQDGQTITSPVGTYWLGIAKYQLLNKTKKTRTVEIVAEGESAYIVHETPETILAGNERFRQLEATISKCGKRCLDLLLLWMSDYTMEEIAARLNLSGPEMARKLKYKCFKKLKNLLLGGHILKS